MSTISVKKITSRKNYEFHVEHFASAEEVVTLSREREISNSCFQNYREGVNKKFTGVASYDEALELLRNGYEPVVKELEGALKTTSPNGKRIKFQNSVAGFAPVVPLALKGVPNCMIDTHMTPIKCKVLDVYYNMTFPAYVDKQEIIDTGKSILSAIVNLEKQGYRFNLYAMQSYSDNKGTDVMVIKVKSASKPLDIRRISFPLTHVAFFRLIGFDWLSRFPIGRYRCGLGHTMNREFGKYVDGIAKEVFGKNIVYFEGDLIRQKKEGYIKEVLENAGKGR